MKPTREQLMEWGVAFIKATPKGATYEDGLAVLEDLTVSLAMLEDCGPKN